MVFLINYRAIIICMFWQKRETTSPCRAAWWQRSNTDGNLPFEDTQDHWQGLPDQNARVEENLAQDCV